ncbi:MAG TPA: ATP-binding protein, partial [Gemmatimonadaceae bacterium]|nr:ATP-binding protein [Gemmatimonadaceae bacterium]
MDRRTPTGVVTGRLLGAGEFVSPSGETASAATHPKQFAFLFALALARGTSVSRDHLIELLDGTSPDQQARSRQRFLVHTLRQRGFPIDSPDTRHVRLPREQITLDIDSATVRERAQASGIVTGLADPPSRAFEEYVDAECRKITLGALVTLVPELKGAMTYGDRKKARDLAEAILQMDAWNHDAHLALIEVKATLGSVPDALAHIAMIEAELTPDGAFAAQLGLLKKRLLRLGSQAAEEPKARERGFVGREGYQAKAATACERARRGDGGGALLFVGPIGIGKTALARRVADNAVVTGLKDVRLALHAGDRDRGAALLLDIAPIVANLPGAAGASERAHATLTRIVTASEVEGIGRLEPAASLQAQLADAVLETLRAAADERPLVVLIDDLQHLDARSLAFLEQAVRALHSAPIVWIVTARTGSGEAGHQHWPPEMEVVLLDTLSADEALLFVQQRLRIPVSDDEPAALAHLANGQPLILEAMVAFANRKGRADISLAEAAEVFQAHVVRLPGPAREVAERIALLGRFATMRRVADLTRDSRSSLLTNLRVLEEAGMIQLDDARDTLDMHGRWAEAVTRNMVPIAQRLVALDVATALAKDAGGTDAPSALLWSVMRLYAAAKEPTLALGFGERHAARLLATGAGADVARMYGALLVDEGLPPALRRRVVDLSIDALRDAQAWPELLAELPAARVAVVRAGGDPTRLDIVAVEADWVGHNVVRPEVTKLLEWAQSDALPTDERLRAVNVLVRMAGFGGGALDATNVRGLLAVIPEGSSVGEYFRWETLTITETQRLNVRDLPTVLDAFHRVAFGARDIAPWSYTRMLRSGVHAARQIGAYAAAYRFGQLAYAQATRSGNPADQVGSAVLCGQMAVDANAGDDA